MTLTPDDLRQAETALAGLRGGVRRLDAENQRLAGANERLRLQAAEPLPPVPTASGDGNAATGHTSQSTDAELGGFGRSIADAMRPGQ